MTANDYWYYDPARAPGGVLGHIYDDDWPNRLSVNIKGHFRKKVAPKPVAPKKPKGNAFTAPKGEARELVSLLQALQATSNRRDPLWQFIKVG